MKFHRSSRIGFVLILLASFGVPAFADQPGTNNGKGEGGGPGNNRVVAPEIDPGSIMGPVALLAGGALMLFDRRSRK
jgi:hypothetical protein